MKEPRKLLTFIAISMLSFGLFGQEKQTNHLSYSLSYIPPYLISYFDKTSFFVIPINFEANIHYKPFNRFSFTSGLGYFIMKDTQPVRSLPSEYDENKYIKISESSIRIPIQGNYHFLKSPNNTDWYLKAVYNNGIYFSKVREFENEELINKDKSYFYEPSVGLGIGSIFLKNKPVGIIVEGTIEKYLRHESFANSTWYSLKIGVVI